MKQSDDAIVYQYSTIIKDNATTITKVLGSSYNMHDIINPTHW